MPVRQPSPTSPRGRDRLYPSWPPFVRWGEQAHVRTFAHLTNGPREPHTDPPASRTHTHSRRTHRTHPCHTRGRRWHTHGTLRTMHVKAAVGRVGGRVNGTATTAGWVTGNKERAPREGRQAYIRFTPRSADAVPEPRRPRKPLKTPFEEEERMLAAIWSPTRVIDGRDPARTPQTHERETRWRRRSTAWACWLFPRYGRGGGMALCHTPVS